MPAFVEDQAVEVVGDVGEGQFCLGAGEPDGADEQPEARLLMGKVDLSRFGAAPLIT